MGCPALTTELMAGSQHFLGIFNETEQLACVCNVVSSCDWLIYALTQINYLLSLALETINFNM